MIGTQLRGQFREYSGRALTLDEVLSKEDPAGAEEGSETHEEAQEEPHPRAPHAHAALGVGLAAELPVGDGIHPAR